MILVKLNDFPTTAGLEHQSTSYWLYRDPQCTVKVDEQLKSKNKTVYFNPMSIPRDVAFYLKYTRHFNEGEADFESDVVEVYDNGEEYSEMLLNEDVIVDEPIIYVNEEDIVSTKANTFTFSTSAFRSNYGTHEYSNWAILDSMDNILFASIRDTENLTSIEVPLTKDFRNKTQLKFIASHGTLENVESRKTQFIISNGSYNFEISTPLTNVRSYTDLEIKFVAINEAKPLGIIKIDFMDTLTNELWYSTTLKSNACTLPWYLLRDNSDINMVITCTDNYGVYGTVIKKITVQSYNQDLIRNPDKEYSRYLSKAYRSNVILPNYLSTGVINIKYIAIPEKGTKKLRLYDYDITNHRFVDTTKYAEGINLLNDKYEGMYITSFNNDYLLIDALSTLGKPTFYIYRHNIHDNVYALVTSIERTDETKCLGYTNAIVQHNQTKFVYVPVGSKKVKTLDINAKKVEEIDTVPFEDSGDIGIIKLALNKLLFIGSKSYDTKQYNVDKKIWMEGVYVRPQSFIDVPLKTSFLDNGDSIIFKNKEDDLKDTSLLYYAMGGSQLEQTTGKFNHMFPTSVVRIDNGNVLLGRYDEENHGIRKERPTSDGSGGTDEGPIDPDLKILTVRDGQTEVIGDPYIYDRIVIEGTGTVKWVNEKQTRIFDSSTFVVTRDTRIDEKTLESRKYQDIFVLDDIEFVVTSGGDSGSSGDDGDYTNPDNPNYVAPDDLQKPTYSIFYEFK